MCLRIKIFLFICLVGFWTHRAASQPSLHVERVTTDSVLDQEAVIPSLGAIYHDHVVRQFADRLAIFYGLDGVVLLIVLEVSPAHRNAYAYTLHGRAYIALGYHLYHHELHHFGPIGVLAVLAHEYAHHLQFRHGWASDYRGPRDQELEADFLAAFFIARYYADQPRQVGLFLDSVYASGDILVHSCQHHGYNHMRLAAARMGYEWGLRAARMVESGQTPPSFPDIHDAFLRWVAATYAPPLCDGK